MSSLERLTNGWMRRNKYGNRKTERDGVTYHSGAESKELAELELRQRAGEISHLQRQPKFELYAGLQKVGTYKADAAYNELVELPTQWTVIDVKSEATWKEVAYSLRVRLFLANHPNTRFLEIVKKSNGKPLGTFSVALSKGGRLLRRRIA